MEPRDVDELFVQDRQVGPIVPNGSSVVLEPRQLESVEDAQAIELRESLLSAC